MCGARNKMQKICENLICLMAKLGEIWNSQSIFPENNDLDTAAVVAGLFIASQICDII